MSRSYSFKLALYGTFTAIAFVVAFAVGRSELATLGAPFGAYLLLTLVLATQPHPRITFTVDRERATEGEKVSGALSAVAPSTVPELELLHVLPAGVSMTEGANRSLIRLVPNVPRSLPFELTAERWGSYALGVALVRARDRFGIVADDGVLKAAAPFRVYPRSDRLRSLVPPLATQPYAGNRLARSRGEGIEFAEIRSFVPGDRVRRVNWRASARRQELYVNEAHPERNSDIVLLLDSFVDVSGPTSGTLDLTVRAAASLAAAYLERRDRVGIVGFGAVVRWLTPAMGRRQLHLIVDALLETEVTLSFAWKDIDVLPPRSLPPQALVIALSPLLDTRTVAALLDLRSRGFDLVVIDISPLPFVRGSDEPLEALAARLWRLWREAMRYRYERLGVGVVEWDETKPLSQVIEEVRAFRRYARRVSA